uniref:Aminotransferase-like plant mobile domain-containing protein n=1 Tax=Oryza punctata TaxID=4537 RepID=A0A0E0KJD1_ORYPU
MEQNLDPGPVDKSVLVQQELHKSEAISVGKAYKPVRFVEHGTKLIQWEVRHEGMLAILDFTWYSSDRTNRLSLGQLFLELLGQEFQQIKGGSINIAWLLETFKNLPEGASQSTYWEDTWHFSVILMPRERWLGELLFLLTSTENLGRPAEGQGAKANCCAFLTLLQNKTLHNYQPLGCRWNVPFKNRENVRSMDHEFYRHGLDTLSDYQITWDPYTPSLIVGLPALCTFGSAVWRSGTPLICFQIGKAYEDWATYHDKYIKQWDTRLSMVVEQQDTVQGRIRKLLSEAKRFSLTACINKPRNISSASLHTMQMVAPTVIVSESVKTATSFSCVDPVQSTVAKLEQVGDHYVEGNTILQLDKMRIIQTLDLGPPPTRYGTNDRTEDSHRQRDLLDVSMTEVNLQDIISTPVQDAMTDIMNTSVDPTDSEMKNGMLDPPVVQKLVMPT